MRVRLAMVLLLFAVMLGLPGANSANAAPVGGGAAAILGGAAEVDLTTDVRTFCYNRYTGRFKHWGPCRRSAPRVYCYNRYTGRFKHWGACRRW